MRPWLPSQVPRALARDSGTVVLLSPHTEECPYNTTCDDKTSTAHFLVSFCILI